MAGCKATAEDHCCWVGKAGVCEHFNPDLVGGFCSLRHELGNWAAVHADPRYQPQRDHFSERGVSLCGDFPVAHESPCAVCGVTND